MSLELCILGSGSGGNSTVIRRRGHERVLLLDAGFGPRATAKRLLGTGVDVSHIHAICLTHLDTDHFKTNWAATLLKHGIRVFCHQACVETLLRATESTTGLWNTGITELVTPFATGVEFQPVPGICLRPVHLAHDAAGSHGFLVSADQARVGYATDLGHVPSELIDLFCPVDLLALEANYDPEMEKNSARPFFLKQRIMGGKGHLSNEQALAAIREILDLTEQRHGATRLPRHIVLMHRSQQCNCPDLVRALFQQDGRIKRVLHLAEQGYPTGWFHLHKDASAAHL